MLMGLEPNLKLLFSIFLAFFTIYNINNLTDKEEDSVNQPERANYIKGNERSILLLLLLAYFIALLLGFSVNYLTVFVILFPFVVGILYSVKIHPKIPRLKNIIGVKNIMVAISFVAITFIPVIFLQKINKMILLLFYLFFIKIFINTVLFDVRDIEGDKKSNIKTIPVAIGRLKTKKLLFVLHSSLIPWLVLSLYWDLFTRYLPVLIFCILYGFWYIYYFCNSKEVPRFAINILVEGEWFFVAALCFVINIIRF